MAALLIAPTAALAQQSVEPTGDQYDTFPEQVDGAVDEAAPAERDRVVSALPFSGLDVALLAAAAALLGISGLALRRFTRTSGNER